MSIVTNMSIKAIIKINNRINMHAELFLCQNTVCFAEYCSRTRPNVVSKQTLFLLEIVLCFSIITNNSNHLAEYCLGNMSQ